MVDSLQWGIDILNIHQETRNPIELHHSRLGPSIDHGQL